MCRGPLIWSISGDNRDFPITFIFLWRIFIDSVTFGFLLLCIQHIVLLLFLELKEISKYSTEVKRICVFKSGLNFSALLHAHRSVNITHSCNVYTVYISLLRNNDNQTTKFYRTIQQMNDCDFKNWLCSFVHLVYRRIDQRLKVRWRLKWLPSVML